MLKFAFVDYEHAARDAGEMYGMQFIFGIFAFFVIRRRFVGISVAVDVRYVKHVLDGTIIVIFDHLKKLPSRCFHLTARVRCFSHSNGRDFCFEVFVVYGGKQFVFVAAFGFSVHDEVRNRWITLSCRCVVFIGSGRFRI